MGLFDKIFGRQDKKPNAGQNSEPKRLPTLEEFPSIDARDRMGVIMAVGDSAKSDFFPFLKYAIQVDADINVKFAALKRIHLFSDHPDTVSIMTEMKNNGIGEKFEPYFSMALSRLGIISMKEFEDKISNSK